MGPKKIIHVGLENQVETGWRTCGALGITLRFLRVQLNLAARPADTSHSVSPAVPGGLLGRRPVLLGAALWLAACSHEAGPIVIGVAGPFSQPRGVAMRQAAELAAAEINAKGGVKGRPLRLRSEEHTSELQSQSNLVCRLLLEKKKKKKNETIVRESSQ